MEKILVLAHTDDDGGLGQADRETIAAALALSRPLGCVSVSLGLVGRDVILAASQAAGCGAETFLGVSGEPYGSSRYATDAAAAEALCRASGATVVLAAGTSRWTRALPGVAHRLGGRADTHVTAIGALEGGPTVTRCYYRQRMEAVQRRSVRPWIILLDPGCVQPWSGAPGAAHVVAVPVEAGPALRRTTVRGTQSPVADQQTIRPDAKLLFVAGAGWTKKQADGKTHIAEAETRILDFLRLSQASLGGSKSLVDLSGEGQSVLRFMTHLNQVGQTGSTPRHPKGLATCCHGEEPHAVGWRFIGERRAVNLDPNCGWARGKADVVYVADAFEVMRHVNAILAAQSDG